MLIFLSDGRLGNQLFQYSFLNTVEKSGVMFDIAKENLKGMSNITMLKGDTREHLKNILEENDNIMFWLDAHWSGGDTYGEEDECPLIEELEIIFDYPKNYVILIDDARLFLAPPPYPHNYKNWQSIKDILESIPMNWEFIEYEDVIYLYPNHMEDKLKQHIQKDVTFKLNNKTSFSLLQRILKKLDFCK